MKEQLRESYVMPVAAPILKKKKKKKKKERKMTMPFQKCSYI